MTDKTTLYFGALLHDIGKVIYRGFSARGTHSKLGSEFVAQEIAARNESFAGERGREVVEQIRYHHAREMSTASGLSDDSLAYITYFADNISAGMDRKNEGDEEQAATFDRSAKLQKVFNIVNGHRDANTVDHEDYNVIRERLKEGLVGMEVQANEVNSLLNLLEATTSAVPSSTNMAQLRDISLYDHAKTTAGIAACVYEYLAERGISNYREALFAEKGASHYYDEPMFLLYSCDMSGIQDFIYNISGKGALKQLRARSLYLEMLLEHVVDELLDRLNLCRANLLYTGGGHAYLLLPNTGAAHTVAVRFDDELRSWFVGHYRTDLYLASAWVPCSANDLMNEGDDKSRYPSLFRNVAQLLSERKASRYDAATLRELNFGHEKKFDHSRECTECHRSDLLIGPDGTCPLCADLGRISSGLIKKDVFVIERVVEGRNASQSKVGLILPFGCRLVLYRRDEYLAARPAAVRVYTKNQWDMGIGLATHIWMGDYTADADDENRFDTYAGEGVTLEPGKGIKRLGVLRADVDNLGTTFVSGIPQDKASISRTATLSRSLGYFFKLRINEILADKGYCAQVIYSGGDDLFIVGNWNDVICAAVDIRMALDDFTGNGCLTISAGIGMFGPKYPIARMAAETGELEDAAKMYSTEDGETTKNAVALWSAQSVFGWDEFIGVVVPRLKRVRELFDSTGAAGHRGQQEGEQGKALIYKIVSLLRNFDDAVSPPRLAYLLARSFEESDDRDACGQLYDWAMDADERRCLAAALEWYVYSSRERG